jgi:hypothetical protein
MVYVLVQTVPGWPLGNLSDQLLCLLDISLPLEKQKKKENKIIFFSQVHKILQLSCAFPAHFQDWISEDPQASFSESFSEVLPLTQKWHIVQGLQRK